MTSTNIFMGLKDGRNSSRVLKAPGGGPTDVLGLGGPSEVVQEKRANPRNISSITEGTNKVTTPSDEQKPIITKEQPKFNEPAAATSPTQNTRGRVPPGGFSSGLW